MITVERLRGPPFMPAHPHVVILGAGASKAAFPSGDRNGRLLPLMNDLPDILGRSWRDLVAEAKPPDEGFEAQFSWIRSHGGFIKKLQSIESRIIEYFLDLELPDRPTIYDYLVLGLRPKDVIATFNWDPLLLLAHVRNRGVADLPDLRFLHGCVAFATCPDHDILGGLNEACPECKKPLIGGRLFFPDKEKDYAKDTIIYRDWQFVTARLKRAFHLTIFGYSGPATDFNARRLLLEGWQATPFRDVSHVEIIDIRDGENLTRNWRNFIPFHHDMVCREFWDSTIARWPRRIAEYKLSASLYGLPSENLGPHRTDSLAELQAWHAEIAKAEKRTDAVAEDEASTADTPT